MSMARTTPAQKPRGLASKICPLIGANYRCGSLGTLLLYAFAASMPAFSLMNLKPNIPITKKSPVTRIASRWFPVPEDNNPNTSGPIAVESFQKRPQKPKNSADFQRGKTSRRALVLRIGSIPIPILQDFQQQ